ncbi:MAG: hypothetical protein QXZ41_08390, partial [Ignisphaera sp.]
KLYEEVHKLKPKLVIIGAFFAKDVDELAKDLGIELRPIKTYSKDIQLAQILFLFLCLKSSFSPQAINMVLQVQPKGCKE